MLTERDTMGAEGSCFRGEAAHRPEAGLPVVQSVCGGVRGSEAVTQRVAVKLRECIVGMEVASVCHNWRHLIATATSRLHASASCAHQWKPRHHPFYRQEN